MRIGLYPKLAIDGIRKNRRLYFPYILTGAVMVMTYYILYFLSKSDMLEHMKSGRTLSMILPLGYFVIAFFSLAFLFYSNSFLIKQRNREFALYNILGMNKHNLGFIVLFETLISGAFSIIGGLILGIALSNLAELCMLNLINESVNYTQYIDFGAIKSTVLIYLIIYFILFLNAFIRIRRNNPIALLQSTSSGEKPPKANAFFSVLGVIILACAYYLAVTIKQPITAMLTFFAAVLLVITATYLLFISGSVAVCRLLQKNKRYYYKPNHFISVSSMVYRMKRNGAGLASICILLTMILVMLSSTVSLYAGAEDSLSKRYPYDITMDLYLNDIEIWNKTSFDKMRAKVAEKISDQKDVFELPYIEILGNISDNNFCFDKFDDDLDICYLKLMSLDDYNRIMNENKTLNDGECLLYASNGYSGKTISIQNTAVIKIKENLRDMHIIGFTGFENTEPVPAVTIVAKDVKKTLLPVTDYLKTNSYNVFFNWNYSFNMDADVDGQISAYQKLEKEMHDIIIHAPDGSYGYLLDGKEAGRAEFYGLYGGLFFIGIMLSSVFLFAAVLIIYYKQISEGYEDKKRFKIMQNIGMTKADIRKTVNSQVLTVFYLPLIFAGIHLAFAFPMIWRLLTLFAFNNLKLILLVTAICFAVFGIAYAIVYKITSNVYYSIVSGNKE